MGTKRSKRTGSFGRADADLGKSRDRNPNETVNDRLYDEGKEPLKRAFNPKRGQGKNSNQTPREKAKKGKRA